MILDMVLLSLDNPHDIIMYVAKIALMGFGLWKIIDLIKGKK